MEVAAKALLAQYDGLPDAVCGLKVRQMVHYDVTLLERLGSPLAKHLRLGARSGEPDKQLTPFTDEEGYEMVLQFTRPVKEVAALLDQGREQFRKEAVEAIGMQLNPIEIGVLVRMVEREIVRVFSQPIPPNPSNP